MMNTAGQQGAGRQYNNLIKPEQLAKVPNLAVEARGKMFSAIQQSWSVLESQPPESQSHKQAYATLLKLTQNLSQHVQKVRQQQAAQQQQAQAQAQAQGQGQRPGAPNMGNMMQNAAGQQAQNAAMRQQQAPGMGQQAQVDQKPQIKVEPGTQSGPPQAQLSQSQINSIEQFPYVYPPSAPSGTPQGEKWLQDTKAMLRNMMQKVITYSYAEKQFTAQAEAAKAAGQQPVAEAYAKKVQEAKMLAENAQKTITQFKLAQKQALEKAQASKAATGVNGQTDASGPAKMGVNQQAVGASQIGKQQPTPTSTSAPSNAQMAQSQQSPVSATLPQQSQPGNSFPRPQPGSAPQQQQQQQQQQPTRPALNTQQPSSAGLQSAGPGSATSTTQPVALSHTAALDAARSHSEQQRASGAPQQSTAQQQAQFHNAQSRPAETTPTAQRYPIPKQLHPAATDRPMPVQGAPQRPSLAVQGVMSQPVVQKNSGFVLEGEGSSRVLSKKKLDELVRQVTGGTDSLTPEVEEIVMETADEFVDNVLTAACRLAKLRADPTLDIRDIQVVLERNYNIRIPGYSLDESRVVRRVQPSPAWHQKMSAINAAKVMGGKPDA